MKFTNSLLTTSLLAALACPIAFAGDDAAGSGTGEGKGTPMAGAKPGDTQTAIVTIPEVSMIDVTNEISAVLEPPVDAGDNFETVTFGGGKVGLDYDISANIPAKNPTATKKIVATSTNVPKGWKLSIGMEQPSASGASTGTQALTQTVTSVDMVKGIQNVAQKGIGMKMEIGPEQTNAMPSHTLGQPMKIQVVYTITADGAGGGK